MTSSTPVGSPSDDDRPPLRVAYVAMKPMLRGRIRRNIMTLLELGAEVTIVNTPPRDDFFQGLESPRLTADFVEVRSAAVRYQAWMSRQNARRKQRRAQTRQRERSRRKRDSRSGPLPVLGRTASTPDSRRRQLGEPRRSSAPHARRERFVRTWRSAGRKITQTNGAIRKKRDLTVRDGLKKFHLINRFTEFWRLSPERICSAQPDLIVSSDLPGLVGASVAAKRLGRPHLHDCHELYLESTSLRPWERLILQPVEKHFLRRADHVVVVNRTIRDEYERRYGVRGTVLRNCAPALPEDVRRRPVDLRHLAGIGDADRVVLYQGGLMPGRGLEVCLRAVGHWADDIHLVFVGDGHIKAELVALAHQLGVAARVHWLPAVTPAELPSYTVAADVGLIPYQPVSTNNRFALPNKVFEYTGAGIPFVASDLPELRRVVQSAECGEVYDPYRPEELAGAVTSVLDPQHYAEYRRRAELFGRTNTWETEREILLAQVERLTQKDVDPMR